MTQPAMKSESSPVPGTRVGLKSILLVGLKKEPVESLVPALRRRAVEVASTAQAAVALESCRRRRYDLIVVREPLADMALEDLLTEVRRPSCASQNTFVQLVTSPAQVDELLGLAGRQVGVCSVTDFGGLVGAISHTVLGTSPRVALRMMVELTLRLEGGRLSRFCQVENVSESGILIRTAELVPVGEAVDVTLSIPGSGPPLHMSGRIVRHTGPHEITGFALQLTDFKGASRRLWVEYLERERTKDDTRPVQAGR